MTSADDKRARFLEAQLQQLEPKLLPCPFCGASPVFRFYRHDLDEWGNLTVRCTDCEAGIPAQLVDGDHEGDCASVPPEVAERWNQRVAPNEPRQIPGSTIAEAVTVGEAAFACPSCGVGSIMVKIEQPGRVDVLRAQGVQCDRCEKTVSVELRRAPQ